MPVPRLPSTDIDDEILRVNSRLVQLRQTEDGPPHHDLSPEQISSLSRSLFGDFQSDLDGASTLNANSPVESGNSTPHEGQRYPSESTPSRPSVYRSRSSVIQIGKQEKKTWRTYPYKGYKKTTQYFYQEIDSSWTAVLLVACFFVSGLVDSVAFGTWSVFVAMQTGNTIFLALRISRTPGSHHPLNYIKCLTSVICYCLGALVFNLLHRAPIGISEPVAPLHRWTLLTSFVIQSGLLLITAVLAQTQVLSSNPHRGGTFSSGTEEMPGDNYLDLIGIGFLAFEAAGQVCLSRVLLVNELPTIVLSTLYHDFIAEALGMRKSWRESKTRWDFLVAQKKQIRRLACITSLFVGALAGGLIFQSRGGLAGALWLAAGVKVVICVAWCVWKKKIVTETIETETKS